MTRTAVLALALAVSAGPVLAQAPAGREARLDAALPPADASAIRARAAEARSLGLPGEALVLRALELAAKGAQPGEIVRRVEEFSERLLLADIALRLGGRTRPGGDDVVAGADALASGLATGQLRALAQSTAPAEAITPRIIAVMGLIDRGIAPGAAVSASVRAAHLVRPPEVRPVGNAEAPAPLVPTAGGRARPSRRRPPVREVPPPQMPPATT